MEKLEKKSIAIQNRMHDSVTHDFDRVSDNTDNGSPLYRDNKMNSQKLLIVQKMPLKMMQFTY